jgi:hypothetical protein
MFSNNNNNTNTTCITEEDFDASRRLLSDIRCDIRAGFAIIFFLLVVLISNSFQVVIQR